MSEEDKKKEKLFDISVDTKRTEELARENERLKMQQEHSEKEETDLAERKLQAYEKFHNDNFFSAKTKDELVNMVTAHINDIAEKAKGTPSGSAPLNSQQYGNSTDLYKRKFENEKEMVDEVLRCMHSEDPKEAEQGREAYEALLRKWILQKRQFPTVPEPSHNPNSAESLLDLDLIQKDGFLSPRDKRKGDLGKITENYRKALQKRLKEGNKE